MEPATSGLRCTACGLTFPTSSAHRAHYQADFHRYNLKRRTTGLGPVSEADFLRRRAAAQSLQTADGGAGGAGFHARCTVCNRSFASQSTLQQHLKSRKHAQAARKATEDRGAAVGKPGRESDDQSDHDEDEAEDSGAEDRHVVSHPMQTSPPPEGSRVLRPPSEEDLSPQTCIFCNSRFNSVQENTNHMHRQHGFFVPDAEYLVDLEGLLRYCNEKVKVGCLCLYCNGKGKGFRIYGDVQKHMESKCHCKLRYEEGEDLHEFRPFYDFSASYGAVQKDSMVDSEGEEWEAVTDDDEADDDDDDASLADRPALLERMYVSELGELLLPDGRALGCRDFARYYKQRYRPDEARESVLASKAESRRRLFAITAGAAGGGAGTLVATSTKQVALKAALMRQIRTVEKLRLRVQTNTNRFHKRPQIDG